MAIEVYDASDGSDRGVLYATASVPVSKIIRQGEGVKVAPSNIIP